MRKGKGKLHRSKESHRDLTQAACPEHAYAARATVKALGQKCEAMKDAQAKKQAAGERGKNTVSRPTDGRAEVSYKAKRTGEQFGRDAGK